MAPLNFELGLKNKGAFFLGHPVQLPTFFLVYFLGIEENRRMARESFQSRMRIFKTIKGKVIAPAPNKET